MRAVFVINPCSGGRLGHALGVLLRRRGEVVHDIRQGGLDALAADCEGPLVACGGDGTVAAVLDAVHASGRDLPVAVVPLGTGNDMARALGWPAHPPRGEAGLAVWLAHAIAAPELRLDRWLLLGPGVRRAWFNYCSLGDDAAAAMRFHRLRQDHPEVLRGGALNKLAYGVCGLLETGSDLRGSLVRPLPSGTAALVIASIPSYAGGLRLGPAIRADDGLLDLFALPGGLALGLVLARRRRALPLGRCSGLDFRLRRPVPMQVDGEPFLAAAGAWGIRREGQVRMLAGPGATGDRPAISSRTAR